MSSSCFKIIACGGRDSVDDDLLEPSAQSKVASEKRGWSFRKKSARHRVLNNTVITETAPAVTKDNTESAAVDFQTQADSTIPDKTSAVQRTEEKSQLAMSVESKLSENTAAELSKLSQNTVAELTDTKADANPDESVVVVIQAAIRGFLAQKVLLKHKNVIKMQAAVRGHLVRRHAVGTLRCVQAIVKMQALVRARHASKGSTNVEKPNEKHGKDDTSTPMGKVRSGSRPPVTYTSIEKLLSNRFARQLLESTPRTKSINIKCDPSKSDSAWKWLERWMSVSSTQNEPSPDSEQEGKKKIEHVDSQETVTISKSNCKSATLDPSIEESESDEHLISYDADRFHVQACRPSAPPESHNLDESERQKINEINVEEIISDSPDTQKKELDVPRENDPDVDSKGVQSVKRVAPEQLEPEGKKFSFGSRKVSNPAFLAAQSKFEELNTTVNSTKSLSSTNQGTEVKSHTDTLSSVTDHTSRKKESDLVENFESNNTKVPFVGADASRIHFGGSECGTELSITSTLDSPVGSEGAANEIEHEGKTNEDRNGHPKSTENLELEAKGGSSNLDSDLPDVDAVQPEIYSGTYGANHDGPDSVVSVELSNVEQMPNTDASGFSMETETDEGHQVCKSPPGASPRSHVTAPEPHGTPSSEVSVKPKRTRGDKSESNRKLRSSSAEKKSPSNLNRDVGASSSIEQLPKDHKTGKRRNSFGSPRPDHVDQEPRPSSSNNPLPSYMQPTESARAKALANSSPRSSPDVQDKEIQIKKRHSLPGANGRHGSPQIQRTMSQGQQAGKGNETRSPQEKKWRR